MSGNEAITGALLLAEFFLFLESIRRAGFLLIPNGALGLIVVYQIVFFFTNEGYVENVFLLTYWLGGLYDNFKLTEIFYAAVFAFIYLSTKDFRQFDRRIVSQALTTTISEQNISKFSKWCAWGLGTYFILFAVSVRWDVIWSNSTYLAMATPDTVILPDLSSLAALIRMIAPVGIVSACLCAITLSRRLWPLALFFAACWIFVFIFQAGAHERGATAIAGLFVITYILLSPRINWAIITATVAAGLLSYPLAIIGRGLPMQGISSIFFTFDMFSSVDFKAFFDLAITNLCEGIFVFAESISAPVSYPLTYKLLSFSPLPSAIDHYESIRPYFQIRLSESVPLSGFAEVYKFGVGYSALLFLYFFLVIRIHHKVRDSNPTAFFLANTFLFLSFFMLNAYPLRNGLKFMLVAAVVSILALALQTQQDANKNRAK